MTEKKDAITMLHGAGGTVMHNLVKNYIVKYFGGLSNEAEVPLEAMDDAAVVGDIVFKSDSHAVKPIFFPGGDIGRLSISGTVNDISALGAEPYALACGFIFVEGVSCPRHSNLAAGDKIILSGTVGEHGLAVLSAQQGLKFGSDITSDVKPLNHMIQRLLGEVGGAVAMIDPTLGALSDAMNE